MYTNQGEDNTNLDNTNKASASFLCKYKKPRNRLIISCISKRVSLLPIEGQIFVKRLSCLSICLPPLRERIHELPTLASIYLSNLNVTLGKQLIVFESKAMEMLMHYDWPQNYTQFKRLTRELAVLTITPYITS